jgi:mannosyltransferase OCH1-like enzyme
LICKRLVIAKEYRSDATLGHTRLKIFHIFDSRFPIYLYMPIPKVIHQTFRSHKLPLLTKWHIWRMKRRNPTYDYKFYDDEAVNRFIKDEFDKEIYELFKRIQIGAAKADFFRYAILYKKGGIYLDIDSLFINPINDIVQPEDHVIISLASHKNNYVQWALFSEPGHPFFKRTLDLVIQNLKNNTYPSDVHKMTGPTVFTNAINDCLKESSQAKHRIMGVDYDNKLKFSYRLSKFFLYGISRKSHWKNKAQSEQVLSN